MGEKLNLELASPSAPAPASSVKIGFLVDGAWSIADLNNGLGWIWYGLQGEIILRGAGNHPRRLCSFHSEIEALTWAMECLRNHNDQPAFGIDCQDILRMIVKLEEWQNFSAEIKEFVHLWNSYPGFSLSFVPRATTIQVDCLARLARSSSMSVNFLGCSILVRFVTPPQV